MPYWQFSIKTAEHLRETLVRILSTKGALGFQERNDDVVAYFPATIPRSDIARELDLLAALLEKAGIRPPLTYAGELMQDADWNASWKKGFTPLDVGGRFTILPPWEKGHDNRINLIIDPGMAFGTGHHETTRSCLALMEKVSSRTDRNSFLDLGTGTGLLAIAASRLGYKRVVAVDTDPLAVEAAKRNNELNVVRNVEVREGGISLTDETFDLIAANLISGVLVKLAPAVAARLNPRGIAILSGILKGQENEIIVAAENAGLAFREKVIDGKWVSLVVERAGG